MGGLGLYTGRTDGSVLKTESALGQSASRQLTERQVQSPRQGGIQMKRALVAVATAAFAALSLATPAGTAGAGAAASLTGTRPMRVAMHVHGS